MDHDLLVARLDNVGDVLLAGPAVRAAAASGRRVHLLCGPRGRGGAALLPHLASVIERAVPWIEPLPMPVRRSDAGLLVDEVRERGIAEAAILVSSHQSPLPLALLLRWAGVERIAAVSHDHAGSLLDHRIPGDPDVHEVVRGLLVTDALGIPRPPDDRLQVDLAGAGDLSPPPVPYLVVHPGASVPARTMSPRQWRSAVGALAAAGWTIAVTGSPEEARLTAQVAGDDPNVLDLGGRTTLRQLGRLLATATAFVGGNTGPMHLAAAVGTPAVTVFAPTVPVGRWRPWRVPHVVLGDQTVPCAGCRSRECPLERQECLAGVRPEEIVAAVGRLAGGAAVPSVQRAQPVPVTGAD
jgi:ADP-heptose:LPS heptosyltransferase